jgi:hypothetical protein
MTALKVKQSLDQKFVAGGLSRLFALVDHASGRSPFKMTSKLRMRKQ